MDFKKIFKGIADYFTLAPADLDAGYDYAVKCAPLGDTKLERVFINCFDMHAPAHTAMKTGVDIMLLANKEGVTKGYCDTTSLVDGFGFSYREGAFKVEATAAGKVLLNCDEAFAEKARALPSVVSIAKIERTPAAPKPPAPGL